MLNTGDNRDPELEADYGDLSPGMQLLAGTLSRNHKAVDLARARLQDVAERSLREKPSVPGED